MPPRNKDPKKPKGRTSAYAFFVQDRREMYKEKGDKIQFQNFTKECSDLWKNLSDDEKGKYVRQSEEDKERYAQEMASYQPPSDEEGGGTTKGGRKKKDKNMPKRAMSGFMFFCRDTRPKLKERNPDASLADLAKLLGAEWKRLTTDQKAPFEDKAKKDKERYAKAMAAYKNKPQQARKNKAREEVEEEEEEEEEEAEVEDSEEEEDDED